MKTKVNTSAVLEEVKTRARLCLHAVAPGILRSAIRIVPVDTGNLQRSIEAIYEGETLHVGSQVHYAAYVEGGTPKMAAQPYLRPALMENLPKIEKAFKKNLNL